MKCPYRNFEECLVEKCPACEYETVETEKLAGVPPFGDYELGLMRGNCWYEKQTTYKFKACGLVKSGVQPAPQTVINNEVKTQTNVTIRKRGMF
ncbi:MAG: hypothetical protein LIP12_01700 [Clostridiales bacterium]|nr:hypothetical protein [Clostridiales bacterium]